MDQVGQGFHGDQGDPAEKPERGKHHQIVIEISINLTYWDRADADCGFATVSESRERMGATTVWRTSVFMLL